MKAIKPNFDAVEFSSLPDVLDFFKEESTCMNYLEHIRWKEGRYCPHCGSLDKPYMLKDGYKCSEKSCRRKFSVLKGTIFENTKVPLRLWFASVFLSVSHKYGLSSAQLARDLNIMQKTAWFLLHRIRKACDIYEDVPEEMRVRLGGIVEADETYVGGKFKNKSPQRRMQGTQGRSLAEKHVIFGALQREGELRAKVVDNAQADTLKAELLHWLIVSKQTTLVTDEWKGYLWAGEYFKHIRIRHKKKIMTRGKWHLNGIEGAWGMLKRRLAHMHSVDYKYLQRVVDEFVWMYNKRNLSIHERFVALLENACVKRVSFKELTADLPVNPIRKSDHLRIIHGNMNSKMILKMEYKNEKKKWSTREVEPIGLIKYAGGWHMIAWCHKRKGYRDFRVLRIKRIEDAGKPFTIAEHMTIQRYLSNSHLGKQVEMYGLYEMAA